LDFLLANGDPGLLPNEVLIPHVIPLVGADVDRSAGSDTRSLSATGGDTPRFIENGREKDAKAVERVELDRREFRFVPSGDVDRLLATVAWRDKGGVLLSTE